MESKKICAEERALREKIEETLSSTIAGEWFDGTWKQLYRERNIIIKRFYQNKTQMEIAEEIGISQAQVSRLEKGALEKMRKQF